MAARPAPPGRPPGPRHPTSEAPVAHAGRSVCPAVATSAGVCPTTRSVQHDVRASGRRSRLSHLMSSAATGWLNRPLRADQRQADPVRPRQDPQPRTPFGEQHQHQGDNHRRQRQTNRALHELGADPARACPNGAWRSSRPDLAHHVRNRNLHTQPVTALRLNNSLSPNKAPRGKAETILPRLEQTRRAPVLESLLTFTDYNRRAHSGCSGAWPSSHSTAPGARMCSQGTSYAGPD